MSMSGAFRTAPCPLRWKVQYDQIKGNRPFTLHTLLYSYGFIVFKWMSEVSSHTATRVDVLRVDAGDGKSVLYPKYEMWSD